MSKTFRVYLALPDDTPLRIGMSVEANVIVRESNNALVVPAEAIVEGTVFRIEGDRLRRTPVKTGIKGTRMVEILSGLDEGARIATPAKGDWSDGQRVRLVTP